MKLDLHDLALPPDLHVARVGDVVLVHGEPQRELVITIHPVTTLPVDRWVRATLADVPLVTLTPEIETVGEHRCTRVTLQQDRLRRVVMFVATNDGTGGSLPLVLASTDDRHDALFEAVVASVRGHHPLRHWMD